MLTTTLATAALVINELMAANVGEVMSPAINFDSWIELYNPGDAPVNLGGMYLSLDENNPMAWQLPSDLGSVPAKGFKVIWLGSNNIKDTQAPFKLDCDGGTVYLSDSNGSLVASQDYPEAMSRTAWARKSDGGSEWGWTSNATPGATNATAKFADTRLDAPSVSVNSCLFDGTLNVSVSIPAGARLMYTTDGSVPTAPKGDGGEASPWTDYVVNGDSEGPEAVSLISRDADGNSDVSRIVDGAGVNNSRGIKIRTIKNREHNYDAQLFVYTPDHIWRSGEKYRFRMKVRADKATHITAQTHTTPHNYIYGSILDGSYNVTTQWQEIVYEGTITDQQVGKQGGGGGWWGWGGQETVEDMQTIAFNLNDDQLDNYIYFDDVSWELYTADGQATDATQESKDGRFTFSKTTSLCLRLYQDGFLPSVPVIRSYIKTSNAYSLHVISIVGDKKHFTDPKIGFDCDGDGTNGVTGNGQDWPRNYNQDWDRPVNFSYMTPGGQTLFSQDVNISVSGGWTRSQSHRSFKLKSNKVFDGQNRFDFSFFPQKPYIRSKALLVRNGGNDVWTHNARFMDPALETIIQRSGIDLDVQSYVPIIEYVNGELRGVLNLREPNNDKFAYSNWGYDDEELDAFENLTMKNGDAGVLNRIFGLAASINEPGAYEELQSLLDIDEFTNYMAVTMFLDNDDWPNNNIKGYRSQNDGRYRFVSFDLDYAFALCGNNTYNEDPFKFFQRFKNNGAVNQDFVIFFLNMLNHDGFRRKFIDTFCIVAGSVFEPGRAGAIVDELLSVVQPMTQLMRQQGINDGTEPQRSASTIKNKLSGRSKKMTGHLKGWSYAKLSTTAQSVSLTSDTEGAHIYVNGINVPYADFSGHLFAPVTLRAEAPAGYRFAGWKKGGTMLSTNEEVVLPSGSVSLTATFTPLSDEELAAEGITPVRINEVSAANGIYVNEYFKRNDWVELYNTTDESIDVAGMYLTDNPDKPKKYQIAGGNTVIPAHGYLIIWCDKLDSASEPHASFKLAAEGDELILTAADESWSDCLAYGPMKADETAGRYPDGASQVITMNVPTIARANITSSYASEVSQPVADGISDLAAATGLKARYAVGSIAVRAAIDGPASVSITSLSGQRMDYRTATLASGYAEIPVSHLRAGAYVATVTDAGGHTVTIKFAKK